MSTRRGFTYLMGGNAAAFAIQFAASVAIARLLGPSELGVYAASMAALMVINAVLSAGLQSYIVREREMPAAKLGTVYMLTLAQAGLVAAALLLGAPVVGWFTHDPRVAQSFRILAWFGALNPILITVYGLMQRAMQFERVAVATVVNVGVSAAFTIGFAVAGYSWRSMPLGAGFGVTVTLTVALLWQRSDIVGIPLSRAYVRPMLAYCTRMATASFIMNLTNRAPDFILTRASGASATGLYNRGATLIDTFNNSVMQAVQRVMASQMARDRDTSAGIGPVYAKMSRYVTGMFWPAFALIAVLAKPIIVFLFGARWLPAAPVLAIIAVGGAINLMVANRSGVLVTVGRERDLPRLEAVRGVIGVLLFTVAAYWGGLVWAALTRVSDAIIAVLLYSPGIHAATGLGWDAMLRAFIRSACVAAITAAPAVVVMAWHGWPERLATPELIGLGFVSAAMWLAAVFLTRHELSHEVTRVAGQLRAMLPRTV